MSGHVKSENAALSVRTQNALRRFLQWWTTPEPQDTYREVNRTGLIALYRKELRDYCRSKRLLIVICLVAAAGLASLYGAVSSVRAEVMENGGTFVFLDLFHTSGRNIPSLVSFLSFLGPLVGLALGFDSLNGERTRGTLPRLLSQPIYRDTVFNGKFAAGVTVIGVVSVCLMLLYTGIGLLVVGIPPTGEEVVRLLIFTLFTIVYIALWLALSMLASLSFKHSATSALVVIGVWVFFSYFLSLLVNLIAPVTANMTMEQALRNSDINDVLRRISPSTVYLEAIAAVLDPTSRTVGTSNAVALINQGYATKGSLSLGQSLLLVWPFLIGLIAEMIVSFGVAYLVFMRQEIRNS